ncbi:hypothetical protein F-S17_0224 [Faustovirus]|nr:hypothetical protein F-S17_0224 [Faustovirus]QJX74001.1 hypothetical protein F-E9_247 [Faustovirus]
MNTNAQPVNYKIILALIFGVSMILAVCFTIGQLMITIGSIIESNSDAAKYAACQCITLKTDDIIALLGWSVMLAFAIGAFIKVGRWLANFKFVSICTVVDKRATIEMV